MDRDDLEMFTGAIRQAAAKAAGGSLDPGLEEIGWAEALEVETATAVSVLFTVQGETNTSSSALGRVMGFRLGAEPTAAVLLPALGRTDPPGTLAGQAVAVEGLAHADADVYLVAAGGTVVAVERPHLTVSPVRGVDPALGMVAVAAGAAPFTETPCRDWDSAVAAGQLALGYELVGCSRAMLARARQHALERVQFDRPIAQFQALRHKLADTFVAIEGAQAVLDAAWDDPSLAGPAKALAGKAARTSAKHCQQVLAGIGFTAEHGFYLYLRRVLVLEQLLGSSALLTERLGAELLATARMPSPIPL